MYFCKAAAAQRMLQHMHHRCCFMYNFTKVLTFCSSSCCTSDMYNIQISPYKARWGWTETRYWCQYLWCAGLIVQQTQVTVPCRIPEWYCTCLHWTGHMTTLLAAVGIDINLQQQQRCVNGLHQHQLFIRMITHEWHHLSTDSIIRSVKRLWILVTVIHLII